MTEKKRLAMTEKKRLAMTRKEVRYHCSYERVHLIAITTEQCYTLRYYMKEISGEKS